MDSRYNELVFKLQKGPAVLFLGQKTLSLGEEEDTFLSKILSKYGPIETKETDYNNLLKSKISTDYEASATWIDSLANNMMVPLWLERISRIPWSHVYTSSINNIVDRAFEADWRKVQPVYDEKFKVSDIRNRHNLHLTHLYGCFSQIDPGKRVPVTLSDKARRRMICSNFLQKLPEIVTPQGTLIIEGYLEKYDWLTIEDLFAIVSRFNEEQVFYFSASKDVLRNELIAELVAARKMQIFEESFSSILSEVEALGELRISEPEAEDYYGKWIFIGDKRTKVPQKVLNTISRTALVIDESMFLEEKYLDEDDKYLELRKFLSSSSSHPQWNGYPLGFAIKRDYYNDLKKKILDKIALSGKNENPIILYGQASSGKTISLGQIAYEFSQILKFPVLFIEKKYQRVDAKEIDEFCQWAEENRASNTIVIWDGAVEMESYYTLIKKLNTRGRNVILVGSSYQSNESKKSNESYFESPVELSDSENKSFVAFIEKVDPSLADIFHKIDTPNLLAMLYRYLPTTRKSIITSLKSEFDFFMKLIRETPLSQKMEAKNSLQEALINAGIVTQSDVNELNSSTYIDGDEIKISDKLIYLIMVPGQFGLEVPFELLMRILGYEIFSSNMFHSLNKVNILSWNEDSIGNILVGPRTAIEAHILVKQLGSRKAEVEYIKMLLQDIRSDDLNILGLDSNPEIQFSIELLNKISPNVSDQYFDYLIDVTRVLENVRLNKNAYHPRLILKEAFFLRELAKSGRLPSEENPLLLLDKAELIVREALDLLDDQPGRNITSYLKVELASILGTKTIQYGDKENQTEEAKLTYLLFKDLFSTSFITHPENYRALDVIAWTTEFMLEKKLLSDEERLRAEVDMIHLFDLAEIEGVNELHMESFLGRKLKFYDLIKNKKYAQSIFLELEKLGYKLGYYYNAQQILGNVDLASIQNSQESIAKFTDVYKYLISNYTHIRGDGKCLHLLLKSWWISKCKSPLWAREKQCIPFDEKDWTFCNELVEELISCGDLYNSPTIIYLKGLSEFHLGLVKESIQTFRLLDIESDFSGYGRRRIQKSYLASNADGKPKLFDGQVRRNISLSTSGKVSDIYVPELRVYIPFILLEFGKESYQAGETIDRFNIGFNFRGPIATPSK